MMNSIFSKLIAIVVVITAPTIWFFFLPKNERSVRVIEVSGRIEGDEAVIGAKIGGRIREIKVREGDRVKAGQLIAVMDEDQAFAREEQIQVALKQAIARRRQTIQQIAVLQEELKQSHLSVEQSRMDAEGRVRQAEAEVASAEAALAQAEASYEQALFDSERFTLLARKGILSEQAGNQARTRAEAQEAAVRAANKMVEAGKGQLIIAKANLANPDIRSSQSAAIEQRLLQGRVDADISEADVEKTLAQLKEVKADREDLFILAPFDGTVTTRMSEPGEVVTPGKPILTIVNLGQVYLRGFVPEKDIGHVRISQPARVYLDSDARRPIAATVQRIDPEASFTPENIYFREDRVKQVIGIKLLLKGEEGFAKPGMPADGEILVEGDEWPEVSNR